MLFFVIGLPGRFSETCQLAALQMARKAYGSAELLTGNTLEEIACSLLRGGASHGVVAAHQPGGRLRRALIEADRRFIVAEGDPRAALAELVSGRGLEFATAIRVVAGSCAAVLSFRELPGALVLRVDRDGGDRLSVATAIARHLRLDAAEHEIASIVAGLGETGAPEIAATAADWWKDLGPAEQAIIEGALGAYLDPPPPAGLMSLSWAPELFFYGDRPGEPVTGEIDITGRVRCLLRGPQIPLPPGDWLLSAAFEVSAEAAEHRFLLEVSAGGALGRTSIEAYEAGVVRAALALTLADLPDRPIELTLSNERPAFAGHLRLDGVTLTRQLAVPDANAAAPEEKEPLATGG
jgi:hypothetical protein